MVIIVKNAVRACDTYDQGISLRAKILDVLRTADSAVVNFDGVSNATTSFVNAAFVDLLLSYDYDQIKKKIQIVKAHRQVANLIRQRMDFESARPTQAA